MKNSLQLRIGQQLAMTPQLQQAIRLLQLSALELQAEIQQALEANPMLERNEGEEGQENVEALHLRSSASDVEAASEAPSMEQEVIPEDLLIDTSWNAIYDSLPPPVSSSAESPLDIESHSSQEQTLQEHLLWQVYLSSFSERDLAIAAAIIDSISEEGYLYSSLEEIQQSLGEEKGIKLDEIEAVLYQIQSLDPSGVGARGLGECLLIQLKRIPPDTPGLEKTRLLLSQYLDLLGKHDYGKLMRVMRVSEPELQSIVRLIQSLNPRPGSQIQSNNAQYIVPDIYVTKRNGCWQVELNADIVPSLRVNSHYTSLIRGADDSPTNNYLKSHLRAARWFLRSLHSRSETLLKVARCIIKHQQGFLEQGEEAMHPLVLHEIAKAVSMHESTISRVTTNKYMHTPRGIYELKYFFSSHVTTKNGEGCSATAIRAFIKKLIAAEEPRKPLSDSKIAQLLSKRGIKVARRTIAKYREAMHIPPSNERKHLI